MTRMLWIILPLLITGRLDLAGQCGVSVWVLFVEVGDADTHRIEFVPADSNGPRSQSLVSTSGEYSLTESLVDSETGEVVTGVPRDVSLRPFEQTSYLVGGLSQGCCITSEIMVTRTTVDAADSFRTLQDTMRMVLIPGCENGFELQVPFVPGTYQVVHEDHPLSTRGKSVEEMYERGEWVRTEEIYPPVGIGEHRLTLLNHLVRKIE